MCKYCDKLEPNNNPLSYIFDADLTISETEKEGDWFSFSIDNTYSTQVYLNISDNKKVTLGLSTGTSEYMYNNGNLAIQQELSGTGKLLDAGRTYCVEEQIHYCPFCGKKF